MISQRDKSQKQNHKVWMGRTAAEILASPVETLVGEKFLRMTAEEFETRVTNNVVHKVLLDTSKNHGVLEQPGMRSLLGKGPKFIPIPVAVNLNEIKHAAVLYSFRIMKRFKAVVYENAIAKGNQRLKELGWQSWRPPKLPKNKKEMLTELRAFLYCPEFEQYAHDSCRPIRDFVFKQIKEIPNVFKKQFKIPRRHHNLSKDEIIARQALIQHGYRVHICDKNIGGVVFDEKAQDGQMMLHLQDDKGTYAQIPDADPAWIRDMICNRATFLIKETLERKSYQDVFYRLLKLQEEYNSILQARNPKISQPYLMWKLHKKPDHRGIMSRMIAPKREDPTKMLSSFLDQQLHKAVFKHPNVLSDTRQLISLLSKVKIIGDEEVYLSSGDVVALYPSIDIPQCLKALQWFIQTYLPHMSPLAADFLVRAAQFVLENNYVQYKEKIYKQQIGMAMGTISSVVLAIIFMIWVEDKVVEKWKTRKFLEIYKRFIDDIFVLWRGPIRLLAEFRKELQTANQCIKVNWQACDGDDAFDGEKCMAEKHKTVDFMDLSVTVSDIPERCPLTGEMKREILTQTFRKPNNAYAYIPRASYHPVSNRLGWFKGEILRLLINSSTVDIWFRDIGFFVRALRARGHKLKEVRKALEKIRWSDRAKILDAIQTTCAKKNENGGYARGCVFSIRNAPGVDQVCNLISLDLSELQNWQTRDMFPEKGFLTKLAPRALSAWLRRK